MGPFRVLGRVDVDWAGDVVCDGCIVDVGDRVDMLVDGWAVPLSCMV